MHTQGPWFVDDIEVYAIIQGHPWGDRISLCTCESMYSNDGENSPFGSEEANARLIASAPELLEALKEARTKLARAIKSAWEGSTDEDVNEHTTIKLIDSAISKAEGK
jgi:hypothetical protein